MNQETKVLVMVVIAVIAFFVGLAVFEANMESRTYNRLTGAHTTWWDAMWVELRVMEAPKKD